MMFSLMRLCFSWLPTPLYYLVSGVFSVFAIIVAIHIIRFVVDLLKFFVELGGGLASKVVGFFVK